MKAVCDAKIGKAFHDRLITVFLQESGLTVAKIKPDSRKDTINFSISKSSPTCPFGELADLRKKRTWLKIPAVVPPRRKGIVMDAHSQQGIWYELKPKKLAKKDRKHPWLFAEYLEFPSQREDGNYYMAFLFRNEDRTVFGVKEYWDLHTDDLRDLATHVVLDAEFRKSLISDDPMLPKMWKKR